MAAVTRGKEKNKSPMRAPKLDKFTLGKMARNLNGKRVRW